MKLIVSIIRWFFGLTLSLVSTAGFASGETMLAIFVLVSGLLLIPPISKIFFGKNEEKGNLDKANRKQAKFKSNLESIPFPDRLDSIGWHISSIEKGFATNDYGLVNLSYAKLIESLHQQNVNEKGKYDNQLQIIRNEYEEFRNKYNLEYPQQFLPPSGRKKNPTLPSSENLIESKEDVNTLTINLNKTELINRINDGTIGKGKRETSIEDLTGFYGQNVFSTNNSFCISYSNGYFHDNNWISGELALLKENTLQFKKKIDRPHNCFVSNNGFVICCDWQNSDELIGVFYIFNFKGEQVFAKKTSANLGASGISDDGKVAIFETHNSDTEDGDKLFIIDIESKQIINKFERPKSFLAARIDSNNQRVRLIDNRQFEYEIDYNGKQTNVDEYEKQIITKGTIYDRLWLYSTKSDEIKLKDLEYILLLKNALTDNDASYSYGLDRLYRMIGEYYEANGEIQQTIENWEKAIEINPKIGIKRKLDALRKKE